MATNIVARVAKFGAIAAIAVGFALTGQSVASASDVAPAAPSITVTPSSGLANGQTVTVAGQGLAPGVYHIGECAAVSASAFACNQADDRDVTAGASGTLSTPLVVRASFVGVTASGTSHSVNCKTVSCVIGVFNDAFQGGAVPISFN